MGTDHVFHKRKNAVKKLKKARREKKNILIVCEGSKTELNYFKSFPKRGSVDITILGKGSSSLKLVQQAQKLNKDFKKEWGFSYDKVWCVFDRDASNKNREKCQFNSAVQKAESHKFGIAYSNDSFELWFLLHFELTQTQIGREDCIKRLEQHLGSKYEKSNPDMYSILVDKQSVAIKNAKSLLKHYSSSDQPADRNPCTTVHFLVEELNSLQ